MTGPTFLRGIRRLAERYDVFVVDLWGTLHDGASAYPGAVRALRRLRDKGKLVALLSNAPRRSAETARIIEAVGIAPDLYSLIETAGEAAHIALRDRSDPWHRRLRGQCWHLGPARDRDIFAGLDLDLRETPGGAGFCVATGAAMNEERLEDYQDVLDEGLALGLPMICANPDIVVPAGDALVICAGAFAEYYAGKGGDVYWHGKPHGGIYRRLFAALEGLRGGPVDPVRVIAIGDGMPTDIAGANAAGIASALVLGGMHRSDLRPNWRARPDPGALTALTQASGAAPDYTLSRFVW